MQRGELAAYKVGGEYRFRREDIDQYLERQYLPAKTISFDILGLAEHMNAGDRLNALTKRAKQALTFAAEEARRLRHAQMSPEHVLLGLIRETEGVAGKALQGLGVTLEDARHQVQALITPGKKLPPPTSGLYLHQSVKEALEHASEEAGQFQHSYIGTEHLLLALLRDEGIVELLSTFDATPDKVRDAVIRLVMKDK